MSHEAGRAAPSGPTEPPASPRPSRRPSPVMVALGAFLVLAAAALVLVLAAGDRAPLWMIGAWFVLALAISLVIGATVPSRRSGPAHYDRRIGVDPAITGEPREEHDPPGGTPPGDRH